MAVDFTRIWNAYPQDLNPCRLANDDPAFENQCAIRLGIAFLDGGVAFASFGGVRCWYGHQGRHPLRGEELAAWMERHAALFGRAAKHTGADASTFAGLRGVMFCRNFWGPGNQGDHIDLWNRNHMRTGMASYISRSEQVWFWALESAAELEAVPETITPKKRKRAKRKPARGR